MGNIVDAEYGGTGGDGLAMKFCCAGEDFGGFRGEAEWLVYHALA